MKLNLPLNVEIPSNQTDFKLGLMFRESLEYDSGMLFVFEDVGEKSFHMKNTRIPLDVAFITEDGIIDSIKELNPFTLLPVSSDGEVLYGLEVNRGWFAEHNIKVGDQVFELEESVEKRQQLKQRQIEKVKKFKAGSSGAVDAARKKKIEKDRIRREVEREVASQKESIEIEHSDGTKFMEITDIIGPAHMATVVDRKGIWKGTQQITEKVDWRKDLGIEG